MLRVNSRLLEEVLLFVPEVTNDLAHVCIHAVEEKLGDGPVGHISMDPAVAIHHVLPDLWHQAEKPCKNGKVTLYNTASALERIQKYSALGSILAIVVARCVTSLLIIIKVISRANILITVRLLGGRVQVVIPIFAIVLLSRSKQTRIFKIVCIILDRKGSLVYIIVYIVHGGIVGISKSQRKKCRKHGAKDNI